MKTNMAAKSDGEFQLWLDSVMAYYSTLSDAKRNLTIDSIIASSGSSQLSHLHAKTSLLLYRDFIKLLPMELKEHLISFLDRNTLLACCCVSRSWNGMICSSSRVWQQACLRSGVLISKTVDNRDAQYWKSFYIEMTRRLDGMKTYKCFYQTTYDRNLRRVTAVYYYDGKVGTASDSKVIQIWDCKTDSCLLSLRTDSSIASIKFDHTIIIAASYLGHIVSWDAISGQRLTEYMRHCGAIFSFDYSKNLNLLVSGSADNRVKIWSLSNGYLLNTVTDHTCWVLKIILKPYPAENGSKYQERHWLFSMDRSVIFVRLMSFITSKLAAEGLYITTLYSITYGRPEIDSLFSPGLFFDGSFLYFSKEQLDNRKLSTFCQWDVKQKCMVSEVPLNMRMKALLGVGKKYIAISTFWKHKSLPNFLVLDKKSLNEVAVWNFPPSRSVGPDCNHVCFGETSWLDGLDGVNDQGVIFTAAIDENCCSVLKWIPRITDCVV